MSSDIIQSLWIGDRLSRMEQLSIKSFLDNGHTYHLYTYGPVENVPEGAIVKDANDILDSSEIYRYKNGSVSAFSNLFRFTMMYKVGGYWADTDLICVKPFKIEADFVIATEPQKMFSQVHYTSSFLKFKKGSQEALEGMNIQREFKKLILSGQLAWSAGPLCVGQLVEKFNMQKYALPWYGICSCSYDLVLSLVNPTQKPHPSLINKMEDIPDGMYCIHLWHEMWRRHNIDKDSVFHPRSLYELFKKKHKIYNA